MNNIIRKTTRIFIDLRSLYDIFRPNYSNDAFKKSDSKKIREDWEAVGGDIKWSMEKIEPEIKITK